MLGAKWDGGGGGAPVCSRPDRKPRAVSSDQPIRNTRRLTAARRGGL